MSTVYEWHIYCETESAYIKGYSPTEITSCPTNTAHTVTAGSGQKLKTYSANEFKLIDFDPQPGQLSLKGYKQLLTVQLRDDDADADDYTLKGDEISKMVWTSPDHPCVIYSIHSNISLYQKGDYIDLWVEKDKVAGTTGTTTAQGATTLDVSTTPADLLTPAVYTGFCLAIDDGTYEDLGYITDVDEANNKVSFSNPTSRSFAAGSLLKIGIHSINHIVLGEAGVQDFGADLPSSLGYLGPSTPITIWYDRRQARPMSWQVQLTVGFGAKKVT
jgi:hypothetical protein